MMMMMKMMVTFIGEAKYLHVTFVAFPKFALLSLLQPTSHVKYSDNSDD
jgi:hypothetical protein